MLLRLLLGRWFYLRHHWRTFFGHVTFKRAINIAINQIEYMLRRERLFSLPPYLKIDPSLRCQLRCPGCPQSREEFRNSLPSKSTMSIEEFKQILAPIASTTMGISLSLYGEPLINSDVPAMVEYAHAHNIGVWFPTNLSLRLSDEQLERIARSGLDRLIVSLDGTTSRTYGQYRVRGDFDLVRGNVRRLADIKQRLGLKTPHIEWKFIIFDHNRHEVGIVKQAYRAWGFDSYFLVLDRRGGDVTGEKNSRFRRKKACFWLYNTIHVEVDGEMRACCANKPAWHIGNALTTDVRVLWNNARYRQLRRGFSYIQYGSCMDPVCMNCFGGHSR